MAESLFSVLFGFLTIFSGNPTDPAVRTRGGVTTTQWSCEPEVWADGSGVIEDQFVGTISANCEFKSIHGGGFANLNKHLHVRITTGPEVEKVHAGPKVETYVGMNSTYYDITTVMGDKTRVRSDYHIATNEKSRLLFATLSSEIEGAGDAKYIKKSDVIADIQPKKNKRNFYSTTIKANFVFDRPWYMPSGIFDSFVRNQVQQQAAKVESEMISEMVNNL